MWEISFIVPNVKIHHSTDSEVNYPLPSPNVLKYDKGVNS